LKILTSSVRCCTVIGFVARPNSSPTVNSRIRTIEAELEAHLSKLLIFSKNQITRVPANVRDITLREFGEKSQGDMNVLVRGMATVNTIRKDPAPPTAGKR
jgi:Nbl1 / Borealin N terminal